MSARQTVYLVYGYDLEKMNPYPLDIIEDVTEVFPTVYRRRNEGHVVSARMQEVYDIEELMKEGAL
ncbi:hypothetical protein PDM92_21350 [Bacillus cereus]|nr:hypothetical protein [Bacillus cereus]